MTSGGPSVAGRPRDAAIDDAARQATRELLIEVGWDGTTLSAVADRAQVSRPALYRRWPTKTHLVFDTLFGWAEEILPKQFDQSSQEWLHAAVEISFELFADPAVRAGTPGLLAAIANDEQLRRSLWERSGQPASQRIEAYLPGIIEPAEREAAARVLLAVLAGAPLFLELFAGEGIGPEARTVLRDLLSKQTSG
jgi:AcrR family transcriptional regulator